MTSDVQAARERLEDVARAAEHEPWIATVSGPDLQWSEVLVRVADGRDWLVVARHVHAFRPEVALALLSALAAAEERAATAERERDEAVKVLSEIKVEAYPAHGSGFVPIITEGLGELQVFQASQPAGVVDGWRERAERAEAQRDALKGERT